MSSLLVIMEAELSRLRELRAKLEVEKLHKQIRELGGDPGVPPEAAHQEKKPRKSKEDRKGKKVLKDISSWRTARWS